MPQVKGHGSAAERLPGLATRLVIGRRGLGPRSAVVVALLAGIGCGKDVLHNACGDCLAGAVCGPDNTCRTLCNTAAECGACGACIDGYCYELTAAECAAGCTPDCANRCGGADGCGGSCVDNCIAPATCGGGGTANVCGAPNGDGPCALPLDKLPEFLAQMKAIDELVKALPPIDIR